MRGGVYVRKIPDPQQGGGCTDAPPTGPKHPSDYAGCPCSEQLPANRRARRYRCGSTKIKVVAGRYSSKSAAGGRGIRGIPGKKKKEILPN